MGNKDFMDKEFEINSICREDLLDKYSQEEIDNIDDDDMNIIACKMGLAYIENGFWEDMKEITDNILKEKAEDGAELTKGE